MKDNPALLAPLIIVGFAIVFPLIWSMVVSMLAFLGGWHSLARRFATTAEPQGPQFSGVWGRMGMVNYNYVLTVNVAPEGLYLRISPLFRPLHPPLLLPWEEIRNLKEQNGFFKAIGMKSQMDVGGTHIGLSVPLDKLKV